MKRNLFIIVLALAACAVQVRATSVWINGQEQSTGGGSSSGGGSPTAADQGSNNVYTASNVFSNGLKTTQVELLDPSSLGTVFSNALTSAVTSNNGFYTDNNTLTWFNATNSTYTVKWSGGSLSGEFGWTNSASFQAGEYFARIRCVTSRGPGTIAGVSLRIVSAVGAVLASNGSSNNPIGQIISCGYTGTQARGVDILVSGSLGQSYSLDFNDFYLTNSAVYDIASPGRVEVLAPNGMTAGGATLATGTVASANGTFGSVTLNGDTRTSWPTNGGGGGGSGTNFFPDGIFIGPSNLIVKQSSDGANDVNLEITHTNDDTSDIEVEVRAPPCVATSATCEVAFWLDNNWDPNNHLAFGASQTWGFSGGRSNGPIMSTYQIGSWRPDNWDMMVDNGALDNPIGVARVMTNGNFAINQSILVSSNTSLATVGTYAMLLTPTKTLSDPELTLAHNVNGYAKIGTRSMATTAGGMTDEAGLVFCGPSYTDGGGIFTNCVLLQMLIGQRFLMRSGPNAGNYPIRFAMNNDGNIGLSWTNPSERLEVNGNVLVHGNITVTDSGHFGSNTIYAGSWAISDIGTALVWRATEASAVPGEVIVQEARGRVSQYNEYGGIVRTFDPFAVDGKTITTSIVSRRVWSDIEAARLAESKEAVAIFEAETNRLAPMARAWSNRYFALRSLIDSNVVEVEQERYSILKEQRQINNTRRSATNLEHVANTDTNLPSARRALLRSAASARFSEVGQRQKANDQALARWAARANALQSNAVALKALEAEYVEVPAIAPKLHVVRPEPDYVRAIRTNAIAARIAMRVELQDAQDKPPTPNGKP